MHLADLLILLALMRTQANAQSLCKLKFDLLQGLPPLFRIILFLETPTCCFLHYYCSDSWFDDSKGFLPVCSSQMPADAFIMLFIFLTLATIF